MGLFMTLLTATNRPDPFGVIEFERAHAYEAGIHAREMCMRAEFQSVSMIITDPDLDFDFSLAHEALNSSAFLSCSNNALNQSYLHMESLYGSAFTTFSRTIDGLSHDAAIMANCRTAISNQKAHIDGPPSPVEHINGLGIAITMSPNNKGTTLIHAPDDCFSRSFNNAGWSNTLMNHGTGTQDYETESYVINIMRMSNWPETHRPSAHYAPEGLSHCRAEDRTVFISRCQLAHR